MNRLLRLASILLMLAWAPAWAADAGNGQRLYTSHCMACHGPTGEGVMPNAPKFNRGDGLMNGDPALLDSIKAGRGAMPGFFGILRDREILDVIAYLRTLAR